jgi:hypothetical protein
LITNIITIINQFYFIKGKYILESDDCSWNFALCSQTVN